MSTIIDEGAPDVANTRTSQIDRMSREEEFRSALDSYMMAYAKCQRRLAHFTSERPRARTIDMIGRLLWLPRCV